MTRLPLTFAFFAVAVTCRAGEGFGTFTKVVSIERTSPPQIVLPVRQIALVFHDATGRAAALRQRIEAQLRAGDPKMKIAGDAPYVLTVEVRNFLVGNSHGIDGTFHVKDRADRTLYDSYIGASNAGALRPDSDDALIADAAEQVARAIVMQRHRGAVVVPKGRMDDFIALAERGDWAAYLAAVERLPKLNGSDEAYREYALAVGHEGVAHQSSDLEAKVHHLHEAVAHNLAAARAKPSEKLFSDDYSPLRRAFDTPGLPPKRWIDPHAMERWESMRIVDKWMSAPSDNRSVLELQVAGRSDDDIISAIDHTTHVSYALANEDLAALHLAGVSWDVIDRMRAKAGLGRRTFLPTPDNW